MHGNVETAAGKQPKTGRASAPKRPIVVRKMGFEFKNVPRRWLAGAAFPSHIVNGLSMLFPEGERFFIRSVKHYMDRIDDPGLKERVRAFFGQEARHGLEHESTFTMLEEQGFEIRKFLAWYDELAFKKIEGAVPPVLRLSVTVALEHYTAALAEFALTDPTLDNAHPAMRDLLRWHACEEIEHKAVAFDVFEEVDGRYSVRMAGLAVGTALLLGFWTAATRNLLEQETLTKADYPREKKGTLEIESHWKVIAKAFFSYLRPGFHPDDIEQYHLAEAYLESIGRLTA
jgi:predicted metal-dependent hydrolase